MTDWLVKTLVEARAACFQKLLTSPNFPFFGSNYSISKTATPSKLFYSLFNLSFCSLGYPDYKDQRFQ